MLSWLLSFVPEWVWMVLFLAVALLTFKFWWPIWRALPATAQIAILGVVATLAGVLFGQRWGGQAERERQRLRDAAANKNRLETNEEIRRLTDPQRRKERERWERD